MIINPYLTFKDNYEEAFLFYKSVFGTMLLADTFWGDYFGTCTDKFNINWMMSYNAKSQSN